jgi:hypothetical protein
MTTQSVCLRFEIQTRDLQITKQGSHLLESDDDYELPTHEHVKSEILTVLTMKITVSWNVGLCCLIGKKKTFPRDLLPPYSG